MAETTQERLLGFLRATSRSFYLGIIGLKSPQREYVSNGYLFCRLMDIFEDATSAPLNARLELLQTLRSFLSSLKKDRAVLDQEIQMFSSKVPLHLEGFERYFQKNPNELPLLQESALLLNEMAQAPLVIRASFSDSLMDMALGMEEELQSSLEPRRERNLKDFENYCYSVAGTVGLFLTRIFWDAGAFVCKSQLGELETLGESFGKCLQIVNITKDFHKDWTEGRCFWPNLLPPGGIGTVPPTRETLEPLLKVMHELFETHSKLAQDYVAQLDSKRNDIRFFCSFPLEMAQRNMQIATESLDWLETGESPKVSKTETLLMIQKLTLKYSLPKIL